MKVLKIGLLVAFASLFMISCDKESLTTTEDNLPNIEAEEEIVSTADDVIIVGRSTMSGTIALATFLNENDAVLNYSISFKSSEVGTPGQIFGGVFDPKTETETELLEEVYQGGDYDWSVVTISQEFVDLWEEWEAAGSDPETMPDANEYFVSYNGSGLTYDISNITETTADVVISGNIVDEEGVIIPVSGSFTADLF